MQRQVPNPSADTLTGKIKSNRRLARLSGLVAVHTIVTLSLQFGRRWRFNTGEMLGKEQYTMVG